jgi:hypothetical protein
MQSQWETTFGCYFTPNRPIYTLMGSIDSDEFRASTSDVIPDTEPEPEVATTLVPISMQSQWETTFGCHFTPNSPIYTRIGSIDSDEFRSAISVIMSSDIGNRK